MSYSVIRAKSIHSKLCQLHGSVSVVASMSEQIVNELANDPSVTDKEIKGYEQMFDQLTGMLAIVDKQKLDMTISATKTEDI